MLRRHPELEEFFGQRKIPPSVKDAQVDHRQKA
jgi:hypothetical protein